MSADRSSLIPALQTIAARLRIESVRATSEAGSGHPSSCCSAADIVAALFFGRCGSIPAIRSTTTTTVSCCRRATRRRCCTPPGPRPALSSAASCCRCGGWTVTSRAIPRRGCRSSTSRPGRWGRGSARRSGWRSMRAASDPSTARTSCSATASRRRGRSGRRRRPGRISTSTTCVSSPTSTASARAGRPSGGTTWRRTPSAGAPSAGMPSWSTDTISARCSTRWPRRGTRADVRRSSSRAPSRARVCR